MSTLSNKVHRSAAEVQAQSIEEAAPEPSGEEMFHFFWQDRSPFSQWHASKYELNGFRYTSAEQGMMHGKALLFGDHDIAQKILGASGPRAMKALGRKVQGFDEKVWKKNRVRIVYENSVAKFTQNPHLLEALLNTEGELVEASPYDAIWGIGLNEAHARNTSKKHWPGLNLLGNILTKLRDEIRNGKHDAVLRRAAEEKKEEVEA